MPSFGVDECPELTTVVDLSGFSVTVGDQGGIPAHVFSWACLRKYNHSEFPFGRRPVAFSFHLEAVGSYGRDDET